MKRLLFVAVLILVTTLSLVAASAVAAGDCKKISAGVGESTYFGPCSYDGTDYFWCVEAPVTGNLRGTWYLYANPDFNGVEITVPEDILGIPGWDLWLVWNRSVFETHRGDITAQDNEILNLDVLFTYGAVSGMASIISGTDHYEGATGWLGYVLTETEGGVLRGSICTE